MHTIGLIIFAVLHGYFAAWLAVWMLFHPREPKFIGSWRVPFTPGLLPGSRKHLESAIADAVSIQLLKPEILEKSAIQQGLPKLIRSTLPEHIELLGKDETFQQALSKGVAETIKDYLRSKNVFKKECQDLIPYGQKLGFSFDGIFSGLRTKLEEAIGQVCASASFRSATQGAVGRLSEDLRRDDSELSQKVEGISGKILGAGISALDIRGIIVERLGSLSNEELENLVHQTAGLHLQAIKRVAAMIGIFFGILSALLFSY